jgi:hypothetical protein
MKISAYFLVFTIDFCLSGGLGFLAAQFTLCQKKLISDTSISDS